MANISRLKDSSTAHETRISGQGMDRRVERRIAVAESPPGYSPRSWPPASSPARPPAHRRPEPERPVRAHRRAEVDDAAPSRTSSRCAASSTPQRTVYLDAIQGGRVEEVLVEDGARSRPASCSIELSNTNLQLDVIAPRGEVVPSSSTTCAHRAAARAEPPRAQARAGRDRLPGQAPRARHRAAARRSCARPRRADELDELQDELDYYLNRSAVTLESQATDATPAGAQIGSCVGAAHSSRRTSDSRAANLDNLEISAPVAGQLTAFNVEIGQSSRPASASARSTTRRATSSASASTSSTSAASTSGRPADRRASAATSYDVVVSKIYPQVRTASSRST